MTAFFVHDAGAATAPAIVAGLYRHAAANVMVAAKSKRRAFIVDLTVRGECGSPVRRRQRAAVASEWMTSPAARRWRSLPDCRTNLPLDRRHRSRRRSGAR